MIADVRVFVLRSILANAYALPFQRTVLFTHAALQVLKPAEAEAILAHELAHLTEGARANAVRAIPVLLMAGFFNAIAWFDATADSGGWVLGGVTLLLLFSLQNGASQLRERHADEAGKRAEAEPGVYARALERLYAASLLPAWVGRRASYPSLYDRLRRAGVTPSQLRDRRRWI